MNTGRSVAPASSRQQPKPKESNAKEATFVAGKDAGATDHRYVF